MRGSFLGRELGFVGLRRGKRRKEVRTISYVPDDCRFESRLGHVFFSLQHQLRQARYGYTRPNEKPVRRGIKPRK